MSNRKRIVIVGATSAIAQHCTRLWLQGSEVDLVLIGREQQRLEIIAADFKVRNSGAHIVIEQANFTDVASIVEVARKVMDQGDVDILLIAHGALPLQRDCQEDLVLCERTLEINAISPVLFAEAFAKYMERQAHGAIALIGSVAGDRGRRSNYVYGAAKGLVDRYAQGLRHRFVGKALKIVLIKPGPTDTPMTENMKGKGPRLAPVGDVAKDIVNGIHHGRAVIYTPRKWRLIMWVIERMPDFIFNKMNI